MARRNVYLPDELDRTIGDELPDLNLSAVLREALIGLLDCGHDRLACADCASRIDRAALIAEPMSRFYRQALDRLDLLVARGGTAEGAARALKSVAEAHQVPAAATAPLPRPTRAEQRRHKIREMFPDDHPAKTDAITRRASA